MLTANATELKLEKISTSLIQEEQRGSDKKPEVKNQESDIFYSKQNLSKEESHVITVINPDILLKIVDILIETVVIRMQILILNLTRRSK